MIINEDLKKDVDKKASQLKELTNILSQEQNRIDRLLVLLHLVIISSILILFVHYGRGYEHSYRLLLCLPALSVLSLNYKIQLKKAQKRYNYIYHSSYTLMGELAYLTEWTSLRKRYILGNLGNKDYRDMIIIDNYITTIERKFSPKRSILNYYRLLSIESNISIFCIILIEFIETYLYFIS